MDPFIAEIIMFGGNFAPRGWAFCDGQLLQISQNTALFSILGTTFGGDGRTTFGLPDLRGRVSLHPGNGPGLSTYNLGQKGGVEHNNLTANQIPAHTHTFNMPCNSTAATSDDPDSAYPAISQENIYNSASDGTMAAGTTSSAGASQNVENRQPFQCVNYIIALVGIFPSRN